MGIETLCRQGSVRGANHLGFENCLKMWWLLALCFLSITSSCESYLAPQLSRFRLEGSFRIEKYIMAQRHPVLHMVVQEKEVAPEDLTLFVEAKETPRFVDLPAFYTT